MQMPLIVGILSVFFLFHDFHVSHTTVHYNSSKESIEITIKVPVEDLAIALEDQGAQQLRIGANNENEIAEQLIKGYFRKHLKVLPNNQPVEYEWVGKELSNDLHDLYIYFEVVNCNKNGKIESLVVENTIFTEILSDQTNIVLVEFGESNHNLTFTKDKNRRSITLN